MEFRLGASAITTGDSSHDRSSNASLYAKVLCVAILVIAAGVEARRWFNARPANPAMLVAPPQHGNVSFIPRSATLLPTPPNAPMAHSSAMTPLPGGRMAAFWWAGSRESGPDVKVYASHWNGHTWAQPWEVASRESLSAALGYGVRRVGNPVAWASPEGHINLFVVATGLGGWAASRVVQMVSDDLGKSFTVKRVLPMSPLFNTSMLVRTTPVGLADGGWLLPAYFEMGIKYPLMLAFDSNGDPRWISRIGSRITTLQPTIVPFSSSEVHAWMRDASREQRVQHARSSDGGVSWDDLPALSLPNQSTSLSALRLSNGSIALLHNHVLPGGSDRNVLRLSTTKDGRHWTQVTDIAHGSAGEEFSYPDLHQVGDELHITYTSRREAIAHHVIELDFDGGSE
ncbi:exo-alpha-sialidase [Pseudoduganella sp. R-32]|uniref:exo-alpha-sialidase n=1 Tax=unclassified Pseudoduganella TaxID=2637179 RepID=UPI003CE9C66A